MDNPRFLLVDENTELEIDDAYDPLLQDTFEQYIKITEKPNLGKRFFNNIEDKQTKDVHVTGLVLFFGKDMKHSVLRVFTGRDDIENLYLYADTVVFQDRFSFPQTNIHIQARRLIMGSGGVISTTPKPFIQPNAADGTTADKRSPKYTTLDGADGCPGGNLVLNIAHLQCDGKEPAFDLKGSDGQGGEDGGHIPHPDYAPYGIPVTWNKILDTVLDYDVIRGNESNWTWPTNLKAFAQAGEIYFVRLKLSNEWKGNKEVELGRYAIDGKAVHDLDNGLDAYASGKGGKGGKGGTLRYINGLIEAGSVAFEGGDGGPSKRIEGTKRKGGYQKLCITEAKVEHGSHNPAPLKAGFPPMKDGENAEGRPGEHGERGSLEKIDGAEHGWLHPFAVETMLQYVRDCWLAGDRKPAKWLLPLYKQALDAADGHTGDGGIERTDPVSANLTSEIDNLLAKITRNLDYYGNPVGWVPRLSAVSNIDILKKSRPAIVRVLHYADKLNWEEEASEKREEKLDFLIQQLNAEIKEARDTLVAAYGRLDGLTVELDGVSGDIAAIMTKIRDLDNEARIKVKDDAQAQAIFSGACKLAAGLCSIIPVGQPYVGEIGGNLLNDISKIDIHSDNPLGEAVKTTKDIASDLGSFVKDNKGKITKDLTSSLSQRISDAQSQIDDVDGDIGKHEKDIASAKAALEAQFGGKLSLLQGMIKGLSSAKSMDQAAFYVSDDYEEIMTHVDYLQKEVADLGDSPEKRALEKGLAELKSEKKALIQSLEGYKAKKEKRSKSIEKATEWFGNVTKGIGGVADGLQTMMTHIDPDSEEFRKKLDKVENQPEFKKRFKALYDEVDELNVRKRKLAQKLAKAEEEIRSSCQTIGTDIVMLAQLNDQRAREIERQLAPITKLFLKRIITNTWELLRAEMYYLFKSYQYRFVRKASKDLFNVENLVRNIDKFFTDNHISAPNEDDFTNAFNMVIQGLFIEMVLDLLTDRVQTIPDPAGAHYAVRLTGNSLTSDGIPLLKELNGSGKVDFRFHELGIDSKGSGEEYYYRIQKILFRDIEIGFSDEVLAQHPDIADRLSFKITVRHSGDSLIRAMDGNYYFFTSKSPVSSERVIQNVRSWSATYNGSQRDDETHGLDNEVISKTDKAILDALLKSIDSNADDDLVYEEHLPGATSAMTLAIGDNRLGVPFEIKSISFDFYYEQVNAAKALAAQAALAE